MEAMEAMEAMDAMEAIEATEAMPLEAMEAMEAMEATEAMPLEAMTVSMEAMACELLQIREEYLQLKKSGEKTKDHYAKLQVRCYEIEKNLDAIELRQISDQDQKRGLHCIRKLMLRRLSDMETNLKKRYI